jgi:hypothetical protein
VDHFSSLYPHYRLDFYVSQATAGVCTTPTGSLLSSCLYLTTLSFESILISYLKSEANLSDVFIAVARGVSVAMGLLGTAVMPILEKKLGLVRAGAWSIWLVPTQRS